MRRDDQFLVVTVVILFVCYFIVGQGMFDKYHDLINKHCPVVTVALVC